MNEGRKEGRKEGKKERREGSQSVKREENGREEIENKTLRRM